MPGRWSRDRGAGHRGLGQPTGGRELREARAFRHHVEDAMRIDAAARNQRVEDVEALDARLGDWRDRKARLRFRSRGLHHDVMHPLISLSGWRRRAAERRSPSLNSVAEPSALPGRAGAAAALLRRGSAARPPCAGRSASVARRFRLEGRERAEGRHIPRHCGEFVEGEDRVVQIGGPLANARTGVVGRLGRRRHLRFEEPETANEGLQ